MRRPSRRQRGWITTALALALLVVVGFVFGAMAGFLWEEPRLVIAYLSGETDEVDWNVEGQPIVDAGSELDVAAAPPPQEPAPPAPQSEVPVKPATPKPAAAKPAPRKPAPKAAVAEGRFAIQVGAFAESGAAEGLAKRLRGQGYTAYVTPSAAGTAPRWRVRVGPVPVRDQADRLATRLKRDEKLPTWVLDEDEG